MPAPGGRPTPARLIDHIALPVGFLNATCMFMGAAFAAPASFWFGFLGAVTSFYSFMLTQERRR